jgi:hypothetical protein
MCSTETLANVFGIIAAGGFSILMLGLGATWIALTYSLLKKFLR